MDGAVALKGVHGDVLEQGEWTPGRSGVLALEPSQGAGPVLHHLRAEEDLLVHRGTLADLTTLSSPIPARGAAALLSIDLVVDPVGEPPAELDLLVLEFDGTGALRHRTHHGVGGPHLHVLQRDCTHYLVALRLRGQGAVRLRHLRVQSFAGSRLRELTGAAPARAVSGPVALHNLHGDLLQDGGWTAGRRSVFTLENRGGTTTVLRHLRPETDYLVHRGTMADFTALSTALPDQTSVQSLSIDLETSAAPGSEVEVHVSILEYDDTGEKTRVAVYGSGGPHLHLLGPDCAHHLVALRVSGVGEVELRHLRIQSHPGAVLPTEREWMAEQATAPVPDYARRALLEAAERLPTSNGSRYHRVRPYTVAVMGGPAAGDLLRGAFQETVELQPGQTDHGPDLGRADLLLFVDHGEGETAPWSPDQIEQALTAAQERGIPTACIGPSVPQGADDQKQAIQDRFDHVLAPEALPLGVDPRVSNPLGSFRAAADAVLFEGRRPTDPDRQADLEVLLESIVDSDVDLVAADDCFGDPAAALPLRFRHASTPPFPPAVARQVRKLFRHQATSSPSRAQDALRHGPAAELQAQGLSVLSTFSSDVFHAFPHVRFISVAEDLRELHAPVSRVDLAARLDGVRAVMTDQTVYDLADAVLQAVGLEPGRDGGRVLVLTDDPAGSSEDFDRQSYADAVLRAHTDFADDHALDEYCRQEGISYLAVWTAATDYGRHYLQDRINAFKVVDRDYVTQLVDAEDWDLARDPVHEYTERCGAVEHTVFSLAAHPASHWRQVIGGSSLPGGYAVDPLQVDFPVGRRFAPPAQGTEPDAPARLTVVIPVYNNGRYLLAMSLPRLHRHQLWPQMNVALVDDGSTDQETLEICTSLAQECPRISLHRFDDGGSGSASRPRNQGARAAATELVAFLDPDNEISPGGYDRLIEEYDALREAGTPVQFVGGHQVKVDGRSQRMGLHRPGTRQAQDVRREFFEQGRFPVISTQAAVMDRSLFTEDGLDFVEGAIGEDTLFGWEVVLTADAVAFSDAAHLIYYAGRAGSVTNLLDAGFFRKHLILEKERLQRLPRYGLLERYRTQHLDHYIQNWYRPRLEQVTAQDRAESEAVLAEILALYGPAASEQSAQD